MASRTSAGVLLFRRGGDGVEVLLAHPGGPWFARRDEGEWTVPKGELDGSDDHLAVARREFEEETGQPAPAGPAIELGSIVQKGGKVVHAWALEGDLDPAVAVSNTFDIEWPPGSEAVNQPPECGCRVNGRADRSHHELLALSGGRFERR